MREPTNHSYFNINSIAVIGNYLPRKCGIATFTTDLVESISTLDYRCKAVAINDVPEGYDYPTKVRFEINQDKLADYHTTAHFLNTNEVDAVSLQHEFGIFGGDSGDYILALLNELKMPVATTLHTVLTDPTKKQKQVMTRLKELSDRFVVMSKYAVDILHTIYDIPKEKITYIPHGIPDMPFVDPNYYKDQYNLLGRKVLLTFGLLSENKGIEYVIKGLPKVVSHFPNLTYIVLGATHPHVLESEGEKYRRKLEHLVQKLHLENHVVFKDDFVPYNELCDYLAATDVYITPYIHEQQITSGTLAYAAGTGKAVISTPYWYAKEMLDEERGQLVPFKNEEATADAILELFEDDIKRHLMRKRSYDFTRKATWPEVARQYIEVFKEIKSDHSRRSKICNDVHLGRFPLDGSKLQLPRFNFDHLYRLTDDTGLLQHATYNVANRNHGYCTDDNARALIVALKAQQTSHITKADAEQLDKLASRYLGFLLHAYNSETGRFRNFMSYSRKWLNIDAGSEDSHGRALWALGVIISSAKQNTNLPLATTLFMGGISTAEGFQSPRAIAFTILGIDAYLETFSGDSKARRIYSTLAEKIYSQFKNNATDNWPWLENIVAYSNGKLTQALIQAGETLNRDDMKTMGFYALDWLMDIQTADGHLSPVGNHGWYVKNKHKARFDQQPVEIHGLFDACMTAHKISGEKQWLEQARKCFSWFLGNNDLNIAIYNSQTGGCRDGLHTDNVNQNEGAESTLAWLLSLIEMYQLSDMEKVSSPKRLKPNKMNSQN